MIHNGLESNPGASVQDALFQKCLVLAGMRMGCETDPLTAEVETGLLSRRQMNLLQKMCVWLQPSACVPWHTVCWDG